MVCGCGHADSSTPRPTPETHRPHRAASRHTCAADAALSHLGTADGSRPSHARRPETINDGHRMAHRVIRCPWPHAPGCREAFLRDRGAGPNHSPRVSDAAAEI